jgi:hypothetical protein
VTRVFIFDKITERSDVSEQAVEVMKKQASLGYEVKVYGIQEDVSYQFPDNTSMNFAVIDGGDVIVSTNPGDGSGSRFSGTFFFKEEGFTGRYRDIVGALNTGSATLDEFLRARDPNWTPTSTGTAPDRPQTLEHSA